MSSSCVAQQGFQSVLPCPNGLFPPGLYCPRTSTVPLKPTQQARYIPLQTVNGLHYVATRSDMLGTDANRRLTRSNQCIVYSRKLGHIPLATLWETRQCVRGLEFLRESHFPRNYVSSDVMVGKMTHVDMPKSTGTRPSRPNEVWHMDTLGPTKTRSAQGFYYNTTFTCGATGLSFAYGHANTAQVADLQERWYADTARLRELHGDPRVFRCDNASVNVSSRATQFRLARNIRTETSCPYESHQMGTAERINRTLTNTARTVLLASGLDKRWWHHAMMYANYTHNIQYSSVTKSSPHLLMYGEKPDVSECQQFGCEGWLHRRVDQRPDSKFDARGEPIIFVGYPTNQQGFLVWCPDRGPNIVVSTNNVVFGDRCPLSKRSAVEIVSDGSTESFLQDKPATLTLEEVHLTRDLHIVGTFEGEFVLSDSNLQGLRTLHPNAFTKVLYVLNKNNISAAYLSLSDSYSLYSAALPTQIFAQEVAIRADTIPRNVKEALSPKFVEEWGPAIDRENAGFVKYNCFEALPSLPNASARTLPGIWVFTRKRDNSAKARFCIGGHRQILGQDYFPNKNYCAVLSSRDNRLLLAIAAAESYHVYQTDIVQAFLHGILDDVDIYIKPPERYPCPFGFILKLLKAIYGLHQGPVKFKQEVITWFKAHGYVSANDAETIWLIRDQKGSVLIHALYADDFLHFTNDKILFKSFVKEFKRKFEVKSGAVAVYLGNRIVVEADKLSVHLDQTQYVDELLERFGMKECNTESTPMVSRLTDKDPEKLDKNEHELYQNMVGSLLYLACWTRPDISFAVSELSRFVSSPGSSHMKAVKHLLRYLRGSREMGLNYSRPSNHGPMDKPNVLWGFVDSDWAGCQDTRRSTSGFTLMLNGAAVSWKSKRQTVVALSSAEAEFVAASSLVQEVIYTRRLLEKLGFSQTEPTVIYEDNRTCIAWSEGSVGGSDRAKHIDLREHFVHDAVQAKVLKLEAIASADNVADLLTKPLSKAPFQLLRKPLMGL